MSEDQPVAAPRGRRGRPKTSEAPGPTRDAIVVAAISLSRTPGCTDIRLRDLAALLGVSPKLLYRHIRDKDELLGLAAASLMEEWHLPDAAMPWTERLSVLVHQTQSLIRAHPALARPLILRNLGTNDGSDLGTVVQAIKRCFTDAGLISPQAEEVFLLFQALLLGELTIWQEADAGHLGEDGHARVAGLTTALERAMHCMILGLATAP